MTAIDKWSKCRHLQGTFSPGLRSPRRQGSYACCVHKSTPARHAWLLAAHQNAIDIVGGLVFVLSLLKIGSLSCFILRVLQHAADHGLTCDHLIGVQVRQGGGG